MCIQRTVERSARSARVGYLPTPEHVQVETDSSSWLEMQPAGLQGGGVEDRRGPPVVMRTYVPIHYVYCPETTRDSGVRA